MKVLTPKKLIKFLCTQRDGQGIHLVVHNNRKRVVVCEFNPVFERKIENIIRDILFFYKNNDHFESIEPSGMYAYLELYKNDEEVDPFVRFRILFFDITPAINNTKTWVEHSKGYLLEITY